jgi:hypothetical protein
MVEYIGWAPVNEYPTQVKNDRLDHVYKCKLEMAKEVKAGGAEMASSTILFSKFCNTVSECFVKTYREET